MFYISTPSCHFALLRGQFVISCFLFSITTSTGRKYLVRGPNTGIMPENHPKLSKICRNFFPGTQE